MQAKTEGALPGELSTEENAGAEELLREMIEETAHETKMQSVVHTGGPPQHRRDGRLLKSTGLVIPSKNKPIVFHKKVYTIQMPVGKSKKTAPTKIVKTFGPYHTNRATLRLLTRLTIKATHGPKKARVA